MKLSYLIFFLGIPLFLFGLLFIARYAYGTDVSVVLLVVLSFFPFGFVVWIVIQNLVQKDPLNITYTGEKGSWRRIVMFIASILVFIVAAYVLFILFGDLIRVLPGLKVFL